MVIGYFGIRAKAQVCRLLCEYLAVDYRDLHFTPDEWEQYQQTEAKDWVIKALPFLRDGGFVVTGQQGMIEYIVRKAKHPSLLGSTPRDRIKLDAFKSKYEVKDNIIALVCQLNRSSGKEGPLRPPHFYWEKNIYPKLQELEAASAGREWFLGYLTVADFGLYEMMNNLLWLFPEIEDKLPNLTALQGRVRALERVKAYE